MKNILRSIGVVISTISSKPILILSLFSGTTLLSTNTALAYEGGSDGDFPACSKSAWVLKSACNFGVADDFLKGKAICLNIGNADEREECLADIREQWRDGFVECGEVFQARLEVCDEIGEARYDPPFGSDHADNFVDPIDIGNGVAPNPYFPLVTGNQWVYEATFLDDEGEEVTETITVKVTDKTKLIDGITCVVVNDVVEEDGDLIEDTDDWYAQDLEGNVWYCGEIAENFETFEGDDPEEPELVDIDGSWKASRDGAKAGILFPAVPQVGDVIRQEVAWGDAEDVIEILSVTGSESTEAGFSCVNTCLVTRDFSPLDPGVDENKYYVPGLGLIVEVKPGTDERLELVEFTSSP